MIIKDRIQIGGLTWKIKFIQDLHFEDDAEKYEIYGFCHYKDRTIEINTNYDEERQELTLIHELRHAVYDMLGIAEQTRIKYDEQFIISQQNYDHQIMKQIIDWQLEVK